eukprot:1094830-Prymnesium_polylepis.1
MRAQSHIALWDAGGWAAECQRGAGSGRGITRSQVERDLVGRRRASLHRGGVVSPAARQRGDDIDH